LICEIPNVTVTTWSTKVILLAGPTYKKFYDKIKEAVSSSQVVSIIGQPGMGKTTLLKKCEVDYASSHYPIFLDLANRENIVEEFWSKIEYLKIKIRELALVKIKELNKRYGYGFWKRITGVKFEDHLRYSCGKYDDDLLRLYCLDYGKDYDGMIRLLRDLKNITKPILLIDEVRDSHIGLIHRLINAGLEIPILIAIPTHSFSKISDLAIRRRIEESKLSLDDALTQDDVREIIDTYCKQLSEDLFSIVYPLWKGKELTTISGILQFIRNEIIKVNSMCNEDIECIRNELKKYSVLKNPDEDSKELEKRVRELLSTLSKEYRITYIHPRGKRIEVNKRFVVVNVFFTSGDFAYIGVIRLSNNGEIRDLQDIQDLAKADVLEHEKKTYRLKGKFIITNVRGLEIPDYYKIEFSNLEIVKVLDGDLSILEERMREFLDLNVKPYFSVSTNEESANITL